MADNLQLEANQETLAKLIGRWCAWGTPKNYRIDDNLRVVSDSQAAEALIIENGDIIRVGDHERWKLLLEYSSADKLTFEWIAPHGLQNPHQITTWRRMTEQRWNDFIVILDHASELDGIRIAASTMSGRLLTSVFLADPEGTSWKQARKMMGKGLFPHLGKSMLKFVSFAGEPLTVKQDHDSMAALLQIDPASSNQSSDPVVDFSVVPSAVTARAVSTDTQESEGVDVASKRKKIVLSGS